MFIAGDVLTGSNMYAYCNGNPVMYVDPTGMGAADGLAKQIADAWAIAAFFGSAVELFKKIFNPTENELYKFMHDLGNDIINSMTNFGNDFDVLKYLRGTIDGLEKMLKTGVSWDGILEALSGGGLLGAGGLLVAGIFGAPITWPILAVTIGGAAIFELIRYFANIGR